MSSVLHKRVAVLLVGFAGLPGAERAEFLDAINLYLYASPQRRTLLTRQWADGLSLAERDEVQPAGAAVAPGGRKNGAVRRRR